VSSRQKLVVDFLFLEKFYRREDETSLVSLDRRCTNKTLVPRSLYKTSQEDATASACIPIHENLNSPRWIDLGARAWNYGHSGIFVVDYPSFAHA